MWTIYFCGKTGYVCYQWKWIELLFEYGMFSLFMEYWQVWLLEACKQTLEWLVLVEVNNSPNKPKLHDLKLGRKHGL